MTRHEAQALVIAAVGDLPMVRRIDYVVDERGEGVVVEVDGGKHTASPLTSLAGMTVDEYRTYFLAVLRNTAQHEAQHAEKTHAPEP